jgi:hypothetical protein
MVKCPFCHYDNEDGALFCEQCKSDLAGVEPAMTATPIEAEAVPLVAAEIVETVPLVSVPEGTPIVEAAVIGDSAVAEAVPLVEAMPTDAIPLEAVEPIPMAAEVTATPVDEPLAPEPPPRPPAEAAPAPPPAPAAAAPAPLAPDAQPRLVVLRGLKRNVEYPLYEGHNFIGRADEKPVDIDLDDQEPPDRVWASRQHALVTFEDGKLLVEDLNSANGTFVNRTRIYPGQKRELAVGDVIQVGTVQMKLIV